MAENSTPANTDQIIAFDGKHEAASAALALVETAQREICLWAVNWTLSCSTVRP